MPVRKAEAEWKGGLKDGQGRMESESGTVKGPYSFGTRFESEPGTNPEELIGAAHAGCFSMALAGVLADAGHAPERLHTEARVSIEPHEGGFRITRIELELEGTVPGLDADQFSEYAETAKRDCPVSQALAGTEIGLNAQLKG